MARTPNQDIPLLEDGSLLIDAVFNEFAGIVDAWMNCIVLAVGQAAPTGSEVEGNRYIVGTGTGAFAGHDDELAILLGGTWIFYEPMEGVTVRNLDDGADWINEGSGGWAQKTSGGGIPDAPADGTTYGRKDNAWEPISAGGALEKIGEVLVTGSAVTDIDFTGLDLDADGIYRIEAFVIPAATGAHITRLYYNGDTTAANYQRQEYDAATTALSASAASDAMIFSTSGSIPNTANPFSFGATIRKASGAKPMADSSGGSILSGSGNPFFIGVVHRWNNTANVTGIKLRNSITSGFGVGTRVRLYRLN